MDVIVAPEYRRRGLGSALVDFLVRHARLWSATSLQARPYADQAHALRILEVRGFLETMRMTGLCLDDVESAAVGQVSELRRTLDSRGLRITTLAEELDADAKSWEKLRDTNQAAQFGWPDPDPTPDGRPAEPETADQFRSRAEQFGMLLEACFIAATSDQFVGYSALTINDAERVRAGSGGTAVRPEYHGLGIATALKACCVSWARDHGIRRLATASGHPAMIRVNEKFGFRRTYSEVRLVKRF